MGNNEYKTPTQLFEYVLLEMQDIARKDELIGDETIMVPELIVHGKAFILKWLECDEFKQTFKGNATRYYFGIAVNALVGGMYYAQVYNQNSEAIGDIEFDDIYEGGLWNNVYDLLEDPTDSSKGQFKLAANDMFSVWSGAVKPYFKLTDAAKYLVDSLVAFFQLGIEIKYSILGI